MRICFVTKGTVSNFWENNLDIAKDIDLLIFNSTGLGLVSYENELDGKTEYFTEVAKISRETDCVVIAGCDTDTYGSMRKSAVIAEKGKLLGVSDGIFVKENSEYTGGVSFVVYKTKKYKIGVLVGADIYSFDGVKSMALADADLIVAVYGQVEDFKPELVVRAEAFLTGVPVALCGNDYAICTNIYGETAFSTSMQNAVYELKTEKIYGDVYYKKRGVSRT